MKSLRAHGVPAELHVFPSGNHGMGLCEGEDTVRKYNAKWTRLLMSWLEFIGFTTN